MGTGDKPLAAGHARGGVPPRAKERWVFKVDLGLAYLKTSLVWGAFPRGYRQAPKIDRGRPSADIAPSAPPGEHLPSHLL